MRTSSLAWRGELGANGRTSFSSIMELDVVLGDLLMHPDLIMHDASVCASKRSAVAREERRIGHLPPCIEARRLSTIAHGEWLREERRGAAGAVQRRRAVSSGVENERPDAAAGCARWRSRSE